MFKGLRVLPKDRLKLGEVRLKGQGVIVEVVIEFEGEVDHVLFF